MTNGIPRPAGLGKANQDTKFHIDYNWWQTQQSDDLRLYLISHLPTAEERERVAQASTERVVDYVDPRTGEVFRYDTLQMALRKAAQQPNFIDPQGSTVVDNIFRVFLKNGNQPLTPRELETWVGKPALTILKTIGGIGII
jgi:hypothetical protein